MATTIVTADDIQVYIPADNSQTLEVLTPSLVQAESAYLRKVLGATLHERLLDGVTADDLTADEEALRQKCNAAVLPLAYYLGAAILNVRMSDSGLHTAQTDKTERLMKWQFEKFQTAHLLTGMNALDALIAYLEDGSGEDWYTAWAATDEATAQRELFIGQCTTLSKYVNVRNRWLFLQMLPHLRSAETLYCEPGIGEDFFAELKGHWQEQDGSAQANVAIAKLQEVLAHKGYAFALTDPLFVQELIVTQCSTFEQVEALKADMAAFRTLRDGENATADKLLNALVRWLNVNASDFATWEASDLYEDPDDSTGSFDDAHPGNQNAKATFFFM